MINNCTFLPFLCQCSKTSADETPDKWLDWLYECLHIDIYTRVCLGLSCSVSMCVCVPSRIVCAVCSVALPGCVLVTQCDNFLPCLFYNSHKLLLLVAPNGVCDCVCVCLYACVFVCYCVCVRFRAAAKLIKSHNVYVIYAGIHCYYLHTALAI